MQFVCLYELLDNNVGYSTIRAFTSLLFLAVDEKEMKCEIASNEVKPPQEELLKSNSNQSTLTVVYCKSPALFYTQSEEQWRASNKLTRELHKVMRETEELYVSTSIC